MTLVDSNVLLDVFTRTPNWWDWSLAQLEEAALEGTLLINDVIYAETSIRFHSMDDFDAALARFGINVVPMPRAALFLAGQAYIQYRNAGGTRNGVLPDFFIGAHAEVDRLRLLTRDLRRYRSYFPNAMLIAPEGQS